MSEEKRELGKILLPIEQEAIPQHYLPYYEAKRCNFFAAIQRSPDLWRYFQLLDKVLLTEFEDMRTVRDPNSIVPLALALNAHAKTRISIELTFARCMEEARSIMRDAIETAVYAHYMHQNPPLQKIWSSKDESTEAAKEFSQAFEKDKRTKLFKGLPELHQQWGRLSETGAHATLQAIVHRFKMRETDKDINYHLNYTGVEDREWEPECFTMLLTVSMLERLVFEDYRTRLQLDADLVRNRALAGQLKEITTRFDQEIHDSSAGDETTETLS